MGSGPAVAPGVRGSTGPRVSFLCGRGGSAWSAGGEGLQAGDRSTGLGGPGPGGGEAQPQPFRFDLEPVSECVNVPL